MPKPPGRLRRDLPPQHLCFGQRPPTGPKQYNVMNGMLSTDRDYAAYAYGIMLYTTRPPASAYLPVVVRCALTTCRRTVQRSIAAAHLLKVVRGGGQHAEHGQRGEVAPQGGVPAGQHPRAVVGRVRQIADALQPHRGTQPYGAHHPSGSRNRRHTHTKESGGTLIVHANRQQAGGQGPPPPQHHSLAVRAGPRQLTARNLSATRRWPGCPPEVPDLEHAAHVYPAPTYFATL